MSRHFQHTAEIWADFPALVPCVMFVAGITANMDTTERATALADVAAARLAASPEGAFPEVQAWRRAFTQMGLKPTQYRCASESLLRRYRKDGVLPPVHPLVDLCNATSIAFAIPIAVFDADRIAGDLQVRYARGNETYLSFTGANERPEPGEVIFTDSVGHAHARRWTHRQSRASAITNTTTTALIIAEALHRTGRDDITALQTALADALAATWHTTPVSAIPTHDAPSFPFASSAHRPMDCPLPSGSPQLPR